MTELIVVNNINKSYGSSDSAVHVLKDLSLTITKGEILAITGPSGAGKSTLMNIISGLEKPDTGTVMYNGKDIYKLTGKELDAHRNKNVGFVFQFHYLLDDFTALENVMIPALLGGEDRQTAQQRAAKLLNDVGLSARLNHLPKEMSGGEQQRTAVARALMNSPEIVLADEPTGNLDKNNSDMVQKLLFDLRYQGITVIIVTHDPVIAGECDKNITLQKV